MEYIKFSDAWIAHFKAWLEPVGKATDEDIQQLEHWFNQNQGSVSAINVYWCANRHSTVTIDRVLHGHQETIPCPYCKAEARSMHYFVDQDLNPVCEFYKPRDIAAFPKHQQEGLRRGAAAFKPILKDEPTRFSKKLRLLNVKK